MRIRRGLILKNRVIKIKKNFTKKVNLKNLVLKIKRKNLVLQIILIILIKNLKIIQKWIQIKKILNLKEKRNLKIEKDQKTFHIKNLKKIGKYNLRKFNQIKPVF